VLNKRPVFIVVFAYGGSNLLLNLLRSHPDLCSPRGELNEVFKGKPDEPPATRLAKCLRYLPCVLAEGRDIFGVNDWAPRRPFRAFTRRLVDRILFNEKLRARAESQNYYKDENTLYKDEEIRASRLLAKNLDGLTFLTPELSRMYPDATFIAMVRNGFAVCEGHARRGHKLEEFAKYYEKGCRLMLEHSRTIPRYHIIRYEDLLADPREVLRKIYRLADLDIGLVRKVRLEAKRVMEEDGSRQVVRGGEWKQMFWYGLDEFHTHFRGDANENQIKRLSEEQKDLIQSRCASSLKQFGYL
jgi:hypothetical protein